MRHCSGLEGWYHVAAMLLPRCQAVKPSGICTTAALLCGVVVAAATCGPVVEVSLWEAALARRDAAKTSPQESSGSGEESPEQAPDTDLVLTVCTLGDWDRAAGARLSIELKRLPIREIGGPFLVASGGRGPAPVQGRFAPWCPGSAVVNPNGRIHAPPCEHRYVSA